MIKVSLFLLIFSLVGCSRHKVKEEIILRIEEVSAVIEFSYCYSKCFLPRDQQEWKTNTYDLNDPAARKLLITLGYSMGMKEN